tara:strand:+ start:41 stop:205 length:165 start_codon:yes stop_codon:yes gene_type:complete
MVQGLFMFVAGIMGMTLALTTLILYSLYQFAAFGFVMGLVGIISSGFYIYYGWE